MTKTEKKKLKVFGRIKRNELKKKVLECKTTVANLFFSDREIKAMKEPYVPEFYEAFSRAMVKYYGG